MWESLYTWILQLLSIGEEPDSFAIYMSTTILWAIVFSCIGTIYWLLTRPVCSIIRQISQKTPTAWDDYLLTIPNIRRAALLLAAILLSMLLPRTLTGIPDAAPAIVKICSLLKVITATSLILNVLKSIFNGLNRQNISLHGILVLRNIVTTVILGIAMLISLSIILGRDISYLLSCIGAMAAVLMLIFKDSILGVVAGVKLTVNKMLRVEDWIKVPKHNIDGIVKDITLTAIKVRNWDNSIVTIPPYELISGGFINMEEMKREGGRRIKRSILLDVNSIRFLGPSETEKWKEEEWAKGNNLNKPQVNLTLFRHYLEWAIMQHDYVIPGMLNMVRELEPTAQGVPVEIYLFTSCVDWKDYEAVTAQITDDVLASVREFSLRIYQSPAGHDISDLRKERLIINETQDKQDKGRD